MESRVFWDKDKKILSTKISGLVTLDSLKEWERQTIESFLEIDENQKFLVFHDSSGYEFDSIETHKYFRKIIPEILFEYNHILSYIPDEAIEFLRKGKKEKTQCCIGVALLHNDIEKMRILAENHQNENEGFFSNITDAMKWLDEKSNALALK